MQRFRAGVLVIAATALAVSCARDPHAAMLKHAAAGDRDVAAHKDGEAMIEYAIALRSEPTAGDVHYKLAETFERLRNPQAGSEYIRAADLLPGNIAVQLKAAGLLLRAQQYEDARTRARAALKINPNNTEALLILGNALAGLKSLDEALAANDRAMALDPAHAETYLNRGRLQLMRGDRSGALSAFQQAVAVDGKSPTVHMALANYYWATGNLPGAVDSLQRALALDPNNAAAHRALAGVFLSAGRTAEAEHELLETVRLTNDAPSRMTLADYYLFSGKAAQALKVLAPLADRPETAAVGRTHMAMIDLATGQVDKAAALTKQVLDDKPTDAAALSLKTHILLAQGNVAEALDASAAALNADPNLLQAYFARARALIAKGDLEQARRALDEVIRRDPGAVEALLELVDLHLSRGEVDTAIQFANQAVSANPTYIESHLALLRALFVRDDDLPQATAEAKRVVKMFPDNPSAQIAVGTVAMHSGDSAAARRAFERALQISPASTDALEQLVALDLHEHRPADALRRLDAARTRMPESTRVLAVAARVYETLGDAAKSEETLRHIVQLEPANVDAYDALARLYVHQRRIDQARTQYLAVVARQPKDIGAITMIGRLYDYENNAAQARLWYEKAIAIDSHAAVAANNLAWMYADTGDNLEVALQLALTANAGLPNRSDVMDTLGWVYHKRGLEALAVPLFQRCVDAEPANPLYHYHLGMAYAQQGEEKKARTALEAALKLRPDFPGAADARKTLTTFVY